MKIFIIFNGLHYKIKLFLVGLVVGKSLQIFGIDFRIFLKISSFHYKKKMLVKQFECVLTFN